VIRRGALFAAATGGILALSACGDTATPGSGGTTPPPPSATVAVRTAAPLGQLLVDANGRSLYLFEADTTTASTCYAACVRTWQPLSTEGSPKAASGASQSLLGTTVRTDHLIQVTYNGHPLYYYSGDSKPGDVNGEGMQCFGGGWDVVSPAGAKIPKPGA
jgi:predicted lipoprotein with Yx(FWY)xxD motif